MSVMDEAADMGINGAVVLEINGQEAVMDILRMCDPRTVLTSESDFVMFWTRARSAISNFLTLYPTCNTPHRTIPVETGY